MFSFVLCALDGCLDGFMHASCTFLPKHTSSMIVFSLRYDKIPVLVFMLALGSAGFYGRYLLQIMKVTFKSALQNYNSR